MLAELRARGLHAPRRAQRLLGARGVSLSIDYGALGRGYGYTTAESRACTELAATAELTIEGTYTGKCAAAMRQFLGRSASTAPVLYWNTHANQRADDALEHARAQCQRPRSAP